MQSQLIIKKPGYKILTPLNRDEILNIIEYAGRISHASTPDGTPESAGKFVSRIMKLGHESIIEHVSISVLFEISRSSTHDLVRHRLTAITQSSTRYIRYTDNFTVIEPPGMTDAEHNIWITGCEVAHSTYKTLLDKGAPIDAANTVLPHSLAAQLVMTANLREWRHILRMRTAKGVRPEIREVMLGLLGDFTAVLPEVFGDIMAGEGKPSE